MNLNKEKKKTITIVFQYQVIRNVLHYTKSKTKKTVLFRGQSVIFR